MTDADFNQDAIVDFFDLSMLDSVFFTNDADADLNGDGQVDFFDLSILDELFGKPPGLSYVDNAGGATDSLELVMIGMQTGAVGSGLVKVAPVWMLAPKRPRVMARLTREGFSAIANLDTCANGTLDSGLQWRRQTESPVARAPTNVPTWQPI